MAVERTADLYTEVITLRNGFVFAGPGRRRRDGASPGFPHRALGRERRLA